MASLRQMHAPTFTPVKRTVLLHVYVNVLLAAIDWRCDEKGKFENS